MSDVDVNETPFDTYEKMLEKHWKPGVTKLRVRLFDTQRQAWVPDNPPYRENKLSLEAIFAQYSEGGRVEFAVERRRDGEKKIVATCVMDIQPVRGATRQDSGADWQRALADLMAQNQILQQKLEEREKKDPQETAWARMLEMQERAVQRERDNAQSVTAMLQQSHEQTLATIASMSKQQQTHYDPHHASGDALDRVLPVLAQMMTQNSQNMAAILGPLMDRQFSSNGDEDWVKELLKQKLLNDKGQSTASVIKELRALREFEKDLSGGDKGDKGDMLERIASAFFSGGGGLASESPPQPQPTATPRPPALPPPSEVMSSQSPPATPQTETVKENVEEKVLEFAPPGSDIATQAAYAASAAAKAIEVGMSPESFVEKLPKQAGALLQQVPAKQVIEAVQAADSRVIIKRKSEAFVTSVLSLLAP